MSDFISTIQGLAAAWFIADCAMADDHIPVLFDIVCPRKVVTIKAHFFVEKEVAPRFPRIFPLSL